MAGRLLVFDGHGLALVANEEAVSEVKEAVVSRAAEVAYLADRPPLVRPVEVNIVEAVAGHGLPGLDCGVHHRPFLRS